MPNSKKYIKEYMKEYNLTEKCRKYKNDYYQKNKDKIKQQQKKYYHKHKFDETKSHCLRKRLILQKKYYKEKYPDSNTYLSNKTKFIVKINYGEFIITF